MQANARGVQTVLETLIVWYTSHTILSFLPCDSNAILEGKIAKLYALIKSTIFIVGILKFGIVYFKYHFHITYKCFALWVLKLA